MPAGSCKSICTRLKNPRPKKMPFLTHMHCRECEWWIPRSEWHLPRCKCCNNILAIKPRLNQNKRKYMAVMKTIKFKNLQVPVTQNPFGDEDIIGTFRK